MQGSSLNGTTALLTGQQLESLHQTDSDAWNDSGSILFSPSRDDKRVIGNYAELSANTLGEEELVNGIHLDVEGGG